MMRYPQTPVRSNLGFAWVQFQPGGRTLRKIIVSPTGVG
jgi:hypothetical protein